MFETITEHISKKTRRLAEAISRLRLRVRYYASTVLYVSGCVYMILGFSLLIVSFFAIPVSLLALIPAIYLMYLGRVYAKSRTRKNMNALLWWEVPALLMFVLAVAMLCSDMFACDSRTMFGVEAVMLGIMACPGFFVLTHGHSLFGPTAISHKQLKEKYQNVIVKRLAEPTSSNTCCETQKKKNNDFVWFFNLGSKAFSCVFVLLNVILLTDDYSYIKNPVRSEPVENPVQSESVDNRSSEFQCPTDGNLMVLMCCHVIEGKEQPVYVIQTQPVSETDSGWQCLCGQEHNTSDAVVVSMDKAVLLCPQFGTIIRQKK